MVYPKRLESCDALYEVNKKTIQAEVFFTLFLSFFSEITENLAVSETADFYVKQGLKYHVLDTKDGIGYGQPPARPKNEIVNAVVKALELYPIEKELAKERQEAQDFGRGVDNLPKKLWKLKNHVEVKQRNPLLIKVFPT